MAMPIEHIANAGWVARPPQPLRILKFMLPVAAAVVALMMLFTVWSENDGDLSRIWNRWEPPHNIVVNNAKFGMTQVVVRHVRADGVDFASFVPADLTFGAKFLVSGPSTGRGSISWIRTGRDRIALAELQPSGECTAAVIYPNVKFIALRPVDQLQHKSCDARLITALDADPSR